MFESGDARVWALYVSADIQEMLGVSNLREGRQQKQANLSTHFVLTTM
jgi:hypothetical protein